MELKIAICDDHPIELNRIRREIVQAFQKSKYTVVVYTYPDAASLLKDAHTKSFNVVFLDIEMPGMNGIELAESLRAADTEQKSVIVYVSSMDEMVYQSLKTNPLRFIRKSHFAEEIDEAVQAITNFFKEIKLDTMTIESNGRVFTLQTSRILYIEAVNQEQIVHVDKECYAVYSSLSEFEEKLKPMGFLRVHKSYLVNYAQIHSILPQSVKLNNGVEIPLSKHRAAAIRQTYFELLSQQRS